MTPNVARYAARGARWSALRPNAANYGMPNLELQLGNVRPPLGTRPCTQRSEHAAVARVVDELRAGGSGSKGQHRDDREATLKRGCKWSAEGKLIQRCAQELGLQCIPRLFQHRVKGAWPSEQAVVRGVEAHVALGTRAHLARKGLQPPANRVGGSLCCTGRQHLLPMGWQPLTHRAAASPTKNETILYFTLVIIFI